MREVGKFIEKLRQFRETSTVSNPYLVRGVADNLKKYLEIMLGIKGKRVLLIGEAPGHRGCGITGIPFTSGAVIENSPHPLFKGLRSNVYLSRMEKENTATIVWDYLAHKKVVPLFWNSFPFHPHEENKPNTNRKPSVGEIEQGAYFLGDIRRMFNPMVMAGIGHAGCNSLNNVFPGLGAKYIRHPSRGGKSEFIRGMDEII